MRHKILIIILAIIAPAIANAQTHSVRVNALALATGTLNAGADIALNREWSVDVSAAYNPILNHSATASLGVKRWLFQTNIGYYINAHTLAGAYNMYRKKGTLIGGGVGFGRSWVLSKHWNFSLGGGIGLFHVKDKYVVNNSCVRYRERLMILPSRLEVSFSYVFGL